MAILSEYKIRQKKIDDVAVQNPVVRFAVDGVFLHISSFDTSGFPDLQNAKIIVQAISIDGEVVMSTSLKEKQSIRLPDVSEKFPERLEFAYLELQSNNQDVPLVCDFTAGYGSFVDTADPAAVDVSEDVNIKSVSDGVLVPVEVSNVISAFIQINAIQAGLKLPVTTPLDDPLPIVLTDQTQELEVTEVNQGTTKKCRDYLRGPDPITTGKNKPTRFSYFSRPWVNLNVVNPSGYYSPGFGLKLLQPLTEKNLLTDNFDRLLIDKISISLQIFNNSVFDGIIDAQEDFSIYKTSALTLESLIAQNFSTNLPSPLPLDYENWAQAINEPPDDGGIYPGDTTSRIYTDDRAVEILQAANNKPDNAPEHSVAIETVLWEYIGIEATTKVVLPHNGRVAPVLKLGNSEYKLWHENTNSGFAIHKIVWEPKIPCVVYPGETITMAPNKVINIGGGGFYGRGRFVEVEGHVITSPDQYF